MLDRHRLRTAIHLALLAVTMVLGSACLGDSARSTTKVDTMYNTTPYGDRQGRCYLAHSGQLGDEVAWSHASSDPDQQWVQHLALAGDRLLVHRARLLEARATSNGKSVWSRPVSPRFQIDLNPDGIGTLTETSEFNLFDLDGRVVLSLLLPPGGEIGRLLSARKVQDELRYTFSTYPTPVNDPDQESEKPSIRYRRLALDTGKTRWRVVREHPPVASLEDAAGTIYLVSAFDIAWFPAAADQDSSIRETSGFLYEAAALDFTDHLVMVARNDEGRYLRKQDGDQEAWRLPLPEGRLSTQPLGCAPDGHVYVRIGGELLHVHDGATVWAYGLPGGADDEVFFTVLGDRSLLLAAGSTLIQLREDGLERQRLDVGERMTCRPIMDAAGKVYVATASWVRCYR